MESALREHKKRTLSAHLECKGVCLCAFTLLNPREKQKPSHFVGPHKLKRSHFGWLGLHKAGMFRLLMRGDGKLIHVLLSKVKVCSVMI